MQASWSLALRHPTQHVRGQSALTNVSVAKLAPIRSSSCQVQLPRAWARALKPTRRDFSSVRQSKNQLQNVKDYTAANPVSIWRSSSNNPYENLAIENYLLKNSDAASRILFTYVNWPCVVIGRNQNPWLECNLARMQKGLPYYALNQDEEDSGSNHSPGGRTPTEGGLIPLELVRRRSGGGTVIHDVGNLNFSFIVPNDKDFTRDKHGELVVSVLQKLHSGHNMMPYYSSVRVNERHDIVMKQGNPREAAAKEFKVSGSAFKLTRGRALHHGTILHSSPNIVEEIDVSRGDRSIFSEILSSPAKPYLEAKGVGSVRSPVHNLFKAMKASDRYIYNEELQLELQDTFRSANDMDDVQIQEVGSVDCREDSNKQIFDDMQELLTKEWQFCQTPLFEYSSPRQADGVSIHFQVKHGIIGKPAAKNTSGDLVQAYESLAKMEGRKLHEIRDWSYYFSSGSPSSASMISHLATVFPSIDLNSHVQDAPVGKNPRVQDLETDQRQQDGVVVVEKRSADGRIETEKEGENLVIER